MKFILQIFFLLLTTGCDTFSVRPNISSCIEHSWIKGTYKVQSFEGLNIILKNVSDAEERVISEFDSGWAEVKCP